MIDSSSTATRRLDAQIALGILALILTVGGTLWLGELADQVPVLREAYSRWHGVGYVLISAFLSAVVAGALVHSVRAGRAGRSVRLGWVNAALVLAYGALVALLAWHLGPEVPENFSRGRGGGPKGSYVAWLVSVLPWLALVACFGGLFPKTGSEPPSGENGRPQPEQPKFYRVPMLTAVVSWCLGILPFLFVLLAVTIR
ncbi:hypothetical protein [Catellatospora sp. IY07-71]|uniref:hypothetical protein n=1 Tax=Catellatospora sp. IY07-71 TaxID=2728827 RepID=UPI001BB446F6|nr:hypothetical protein [Catellatospora sp. IY07-71]